MKKKLTALLLAATMAFSCAALAGCGDSKAPAGGDTANGGDAPANDGKTYTLSITTPQPAESAAGKVLQAACDSMTEETGGQLKFDIYYSSQLVPVFDTLKSVSGGIVDIGFAPTSTQSDYMPINGKLLILPFLGYPGDDSIADVYAALSEEFPEIEEEIQAQGVTSLSTFFFGREDLYFTNGKSVHTPADISGLKIAIANAPVGTIVNNLGGAPVTTTQGDAYTNLDGGVVEALIHHTSFIKAGGCEELITSATMFGSTGLVREMGKYIMNTDKLNELPADLQETLKAGFEQVAAGTVAADNGMYDAVTKTLTEAGCEYTWLTDDEVEAFAEATKSVQDDIIAEVAATGVDAQAIFDRAQELSEQYK